MKRLLLLCLALFPLTVSAQTFNVTSSATVTVGAFFYAGTSASTTIAHSTLTTAQQSFKLIKPDLSINPFVASTTGDNRCTALASGWYQLEIEAAQKSQIGLYQVISEASGCINPAPSTFFQVLPDAVYVRDYVTEPIGGWIAAATPTIANITASVIASVPSTSWMSANIVYPASLASIDIMDGFTDHGIYISKSEVTRTFTGVTSKTNIGMASGAIAGVSTTVRDWFSDPTGATTVTRNRVIDYSGVTGDRVADYDIGSATVGYWMDTYFGVDVYSPGD